MKVLRIPQRLGSHCTAGKNLRGPTTTTSADSMPEAGPSIALMESPDLADT